MEATAEQNYERAAVRAAAHAKTRDELAREGRRMEALANTAIERLIRRGFVERSLVERLREQDALCRRLVEALERSETR